MNESTACRRTREGLTEYLEGALSPRRRQGVEHHLRDCVECNAVLEQARKIIRSARTVPGERMPDELKARLLSRLREHGEVGAIDSGPDQR